MALDPASQATLYLGANMREADVHSLAQGVAAVFSARCPSQDRPNEDAAALIPFDERSGVLVVADGLGGLPGGEQASGLAVRSIQAAVARSAADGTPLRGAILDGIEQANRAIGALGSGAATTLAAVEIRDGSVRPYHVGDSMVLVVGQRGKIKLQTVSHSPVGFAVESGMLDEAEALHHEDRHIVSNVIGASDMRIEVGSGRKLALRDTLLLASDGLFDNLRHEEIVSYLRTGRIEQVAKRLADLARKRMTEPAGEDPSKPDDLTFVAFRRIG
ncbi:MAG: protein phosphatase 2C domain-containing protein [Myxococcota bacterium]